jgi:5-methylthioadenosine/S-adenosylhomocysteine deaminase
MASDLLLRGGTLLPMDPVRPERAVRADVLVRDGRIVRVGRNVRTRGVPVLDATGLHVLPGFVSGHVHLCQALFRNLAEKVSLLPWLRRYIWPLEKAHTRESVAASAWLAVSDLVSSGATTLVTFESVEHTDAVFSVLAETGVRAVVGHTLMDVRARHAPRAKWEDARLVLEQLLSKWHGYGDRLFVGVAPRFVLACSDALMQNAVKFADEHDLMIHTHASEHPDEEARVVARYGTSNVRALDSLGLLGPRTVVAHCVQCDDDDLRLVAKRGTGVVHCPSTNAKLGSGIAPVRSMLKRGVRVGLGPDGAPCNNRLDMFTELRQAALVSSLRDGPGAVKAVQFVRMLTCDGAAAVGLADETGRIAESLAGDFVCVDLSDGSVGPGGDAFTKLVYSADSRCVRYVVSFGEVLVNNGEPTCWDENEIAKRARSALRSIVRRSGIAAEEQGRN